MRFKVLGPDFEVYLILAFLLWEHEREGTISKWGD